MTAEINTRRYLNLLPAAAIWTVVLVGLYLISRANYLLFHTIAEMFSIIIAGTIFVLTWSARRTIGNGYLLFLGVSYLFIGAVDLLHTLAFAGMGVFPGTASDDPLGPNLATQLWIAARGLQAVSLVAAPFFLRRRPQGRVLLGVYGLVTTLILLSIYPWRIFPDAYAGGLTPFKIYAEFAIIVAFLAAILLLLRIRKAFHPNVLRLLVLSLSVTILAEVAFTGYLNVYDLGNLLGHFLKIVAFSFIYSAIINTAFNMPHELFLRELEETTAALQASERLARSRASQMEAIMDAVPAAVWIATDAKASVVSGSKLAAEVLRMTPDKNLSKTAPDGQSPTHFRVFKDGRELAPDELPLQISAATGKPVRDFEETVIFDDGEKVHMLGNVSPLLDENGRPSGAVAAFVDITARVLAEQALQESEQRFRHLFETMVEGFSLLEVISGPDGQVTDLRILEVNPALEQQLGTKRDQLEGRTVLEVAPENGPALVERYAHVARTGESLRYEENNSPDRCFDVLIYRPGPGYIATLSIDVTERRQAEESVKAYAAQLERINRELARANAELQDFAFVASHDLQEPLRKIQAFGERIGQAMEPHLNEETRGYLQRMLSAAGRMRSMINDLLELSRVTTRGRPFERVDLNDVLDEVISDLEVRIEKTKGRVETVNLPQVEADPGQMRHLFQNLVANALKFHRPDTPPHVRVAAQRLDGNLVQIEVTDNGIGFEEEYAERIFQPFQRLFGMSEYEGSGIGLAICRKIVERHSGTIMARSRPGHGSTFTVILPAAQPGKKVDSHG